MNMRGTRSTGILALIASTILLLPAMAQSEVPSAGGGSGTGYTCTDTTTADENGDILSGTKSCKCFGGKFSTDCKKMIDKGECANVSHPLDDGLVCTDEACFCTKKITSDSDRFGLGRFENVTDGTSNTLVLEETARDRKTEKVTARRGDAPTPEAATEEAEEAEPKERKVRDHRD